MKVKLARMITESIPKDIEEKVSEIIERRSKLRLVKSSMAWIPTTAKYHVSEVLDNLHNGSVYYASIKDKYPIPIEYLLLTDELYNKLKSLGVKEVQYRAHSITGLTKDELNNLEGACEYELLGNKLVKMGIVKYDEVDLNKGNVIEQIVNSRWSGNILDMPIELLPNLHTTTITRLQKAGYKKLSDLSNVTEENLLDSKIGQTKIEEIKMALQDLGLKLKTKEYVV